MKKSFLSFFLILSLLLTCFVPIRASATTIRKSTTNSPVTVYNGMGEYVGEFESIEDFQTKFLGINENQKGVAAWLLTAATIYGVVSMINDVSYILTGIDAKVWIRENVAVPFYQEAKNMKLYSVSGGISNPYPPHSYQYIQFNQTNYYWVVQ